MDNLSRRAIIGGSAAAFTIVKPELVRGAGPEKLRAGLVGCGGRGTQATVNLLSGDPTVEIVAMGDIFEDKLEGSLARLRDPKYVTNSVRQVAEFTKKPVEELTKSVMERVKVAPDKRFSSFEAFKRIANSPDIDIVMLCTPPGLSARALRSRGQREEARLLREAVRHRPRRRPPIHGSGKEVGTDEADGHVGRSAAVPEAVRRDGGQDQERRHRRRHRDVCLLGRHSRDSAAERRADRKWGDMEWQHRNWYSFVWICGDQIVEQHLHNIDCLQLGDGHASGEGSRHGRRHLASPH